MKAIEFTTNVKIDGIIQIPEQYRDFSKGYIKVIILKEEGLSTHDTVAQQYAKMKAVIKDIQD